MEIVCGHGAREREWVSRMTFEVTTLGGHDAGEREWIVTMTFEVTTIG